MGSWWPADFLMRRTTEIAAATREHLTLTAVAVLVGLMLALPMAVAAHRRPRLAGPLLGVTGALYTVPSLALFALLVPVTGLSATTVEIGLVAYTLLVLLRNALAGLDGVPADVVDAARGMGYGQGRLLWRVQLPLALPVILAGVRIATVSTVALVTVGAEVSYGGLGRLILQGLQNEYPSEAVGASLLCVALALLVDLLLLAVQRLVTPWARAR